MLVASRDSRDSSHRPCDPSKSIRLSTQETGIITEFSMKAPPQRPEGFRVLTEDELLWVAGGDNPGMGSFDGNGDQSLPSNCERLD